MVERKTTKEYIDELRAKNIKIVPLQEYAGARESIKHKCLIHDFVWNAAPTNILRGQGCKFCRSDKIRSFFIKSQDEYIQELNSQFDGNIILMTSYQGSHKHSLYKCKVCGNEWSATPNNLHHSLGCPKCVENKYHIRSRYVSLGEFNERLSLLNPNIMIISDYHGVGKRIKVKCKKCGNEWTTNAYHLIALNEKHRTGCKKCNFALSGVKSRKTHEQYCKEVESLFPDLQVKSRYELSKKYVKIKCKICEATWDIKPDNLLHSMGCKICNKYASMGERLISRFLICRNIDYIPQKSFTDLLNTDTNRHLSYDFYLPQYNLLIEFQGIQHEKPKERFGGEESLEVQRKHDAIKRDYANAHGIDLLEIWYYDIKNIDDILLNYLKLESVETAVSDSVTN